MCRFALYLGDPIRVSSLVTDPEHSILRQSYRSRESKEPLNGDGYGIAWYVDDDGPPAVLKEVHPAWNSINLRSVAAATWTRCLLAHVRAATPGLPVNQHNCHPFRWGRLTFMHNGHVGGFRALKQRLVSELDQESYLEIEGSTDTEHLFALVREAWAREASAASPAARLEAALRAGIERIEAFRVRAGVEVPSLLNLALSDGEHAVVTRYATPGSPASNTLYACSGSRFDCVQGACVIEGDASDAGAIIVASEPLTEVGTWEPVPLNHLVRVTRGAGFEVVAL